MSAKIVRFPDQGRPVRRHRTGDAIVIILPIIRIERYAEPPKPRIRRKARRRVP